MALSILPKTGAPWGKSFMQTFVVMLVAGAMVFGIGTVVSGVVSPPKSEADLAAEAADAADTTKAAKK